MVDYCSVRKNYGNTTHGLIFLFLSVRTIVTSILFIILLNVDGQNPDSTGTERFSIHAQTTVITQYKPAFKAEYTGKNSIIPDKEKKLSITSTLFLGARLWKGASLFLNSEIAGGSGLSSALGIASSSNGETYRVGDPAPQFELARIYFSQIISLNEVTGYQEGYFNKFRGSIPTSYISFTIGKICLTDYFDNNSYNHDPRTQFISWGLMNNGAWDFPANTKGYTPSVLIELVTPGTELRYGFSLVPKVANGRIMNWNINKAGSHTLEYTRHYCLGGKNGSLRFLSFFTTTDMGNYDQSIALNPNAPDITSTRKYGHTKYGFGINAEQSVTENLGAFFRASWNDGNNETWAYTEIDQSVSLGISASGRKWRREKDILGLAYVSSGISEPHRNYLKAGGKGFILGDNNLNYSLEHLAEIYYSLGLSKNIYLSGTYQFILNPGYNKDRGPVNVFSVRVHAFM
ncbi:MAG: carbohydrate porin [Bacteroidetes bacterium]|nr:MAG: carbohydrate porin [Bacteroidota bacterium]